MTLSDVDPRGRARLGILGTRLSPAKILLDHDDLGLNQSKVIVIFSKSLARDAGGKPASTFPHPALAEIPLENVAP
jgi:hypothetical protein